MTALIIAAGGSGFTHPPNSDPWNTLHLFRMMQEEDHLGKSHAGWGASRDRLPWVPWEGTVERRPLALFWLSTFWRQEGTCLLGSQLLPSDAPDIVGSCVLQSFPLLQNLLGSFCGVGTLHFSMPEALESSRGLSVVWKPTAIFKEP